MTDSNFSLEKIKTGIKGFDEILHGGLPKHRTTLITGGPGTGKTVLGLEFLYHNAISNTPGIFVSFEEEKNSIVINTNTMGWDLKQLEKEKKIILIDGTLSPNSIISGEFDLKGLLTIIEGQRKSIGAEFIVIDAIDVILKLLNDPIKERQQFYLLHQWLKNNSLTSIITMKDQENPIENRYSFLEYMTDCVINLDQRVFEQVNTRRIRILKYRGSSFGSNEYPYIINREGIRVVPITNTSLDYARTGKAISSGNNDFDKILGGGFKQGSTILISGASGTGKTTLLSMFSVAACKRGERVLFISFEESDNSLIDFMKSSGINLKPALQSNYLHIESIMPESTGAEEHFIRILQLINSFKPDHIILETISACKRMGSAQTAFDFIVRLINICKEKGTTCLLSNQISNESLRHEIENIGMSSIIDVLILLKYVQINGKIARTLLVQKSRGVNHSHRYWEFDISKKGITIGDFINIQGNLPLADYTQNKNNTKKHQSRSLFGGTTIKEQE